MCGYGDSKGMALVMHGYVCDMKRSLVPVLSMPARERPLPLSPACYLSSCRTIPIPFPLSLLHSTPAFKHISHGRSHALKKTLADYCQGSLVALIEIFISAHCTFRQVTSVPNHSSQTRHVFMCVLFPTATPSPTSLG